MYTVAVTLAGTPSSSFGGCTIKLASGNVTLHEEVVPADRFAGQDTAMNYGDGMCTVCLPPPPLCASPHPPPPLLSSFLLLSAFFYLFHFLIFFFFTFLFVFSGRRVQFEMTAHRWFLAGLGVPSNPAAADELSVVIEANVQEGSVVVVDNVELCERSNQCLAVFPQCTSARLDTVRKRILQSTMLAAAIPSCPSVHLSTPLHH